MADGNKQKSLHFCPDKKFSLLPENHHFWKCIKEKKENSEELKLEASWW